MSKLVKIVFSVAGIIVLLIIAAALMLLFLVNPNDYKGKLSEQVTQYLGQEFVIRGDISWTFYPWLGLQAHDVRISNAAGFGTSPLASIKSMNINVKLLPLLHKQIDAGKISLEGAELNLQRNFQGQTNWQRIIKNHTARQVGQSPAKNGTDSQKALNINISEIDLHDATISWFDQQHNRQVVLSKLLLKSQNIRVDQPFELKMAADFVSSDPALKGNFQFQGVIQANKSSDQYQVQNLELTIQLANKNFAAKTLTINLFTDLAINLAQEQFNAANLRLRVANMLLNGNVARKAAANKQIVTGHIQIPDFDLQQFMQAIGKPLPAMRNSHAGHKMNASFDFQYANKLAIKQLRAKLDEASLQGYLTIEDFKTKLATMQLIVDQINIADYLAPAKNSEVAVMKLAAASYEGAIAFGGAEQATLLQRLIAFGKFRANALQYDKTQISNLNASVNANRGLIKLSPISAQIYQGDYRGNLTVNLRVKLPAITAEQHFSRISLEKFLQDFKSIAFAQVTGIGELSSQLSAVGNDGEKIRRSLAGKVNFAVKQGVLHGINLEHWLDVGTALYHREPLPAGNVPKQTPFEKLSGSFNFNQGIAHNDDFILQSSFMRVTGQGTVDLANQRLNYLFKAVKMNKATNQPRNDVIPIRAAGPFANVSIRPDVAELLRNQAKKEIAKQVDKLQDNVSEQLRKLDLKKLFGH